MNCSKTWKLTVAAALLAVLHVASGCCGMCGGCGGCGCGACGAGGCGVAGLGGMHNPYAVPPPPPMLGYVDDPWWRIQESHGEAANDFVIYEHEFQQDKVRLNTAGQDHVTQLAVRLNNGANYPVVVERNMSSIKEGTEFEYPVHPDPKLDAERREMIVMALAEMGVSDAERRVIVAGDLAEGMEDFQAERVFQQFGYQGYGGNYGGFGGGFGGFGGFGGGGFGGGFF